MDDGVAKAIKLRMQELGSTQTEVAHISGIPQCHISHILNGVVRNPGVITVGRLLKAAGLRLVIVDENDGIRYRSDE